MKPVLDMLQVADAASISFLSGCTIFSMSCYSVGKSIWAKEKSVDFHTGTPLALGAVAGGIAGKQLFQQLHLWMENSEIIGAVQAVGLLVITVMTLVYTCRKTGIQTYAVKSRRNVAVIGFVLGAMSSFLGIGGGPINIMILNFFFSMDTKTAAANSLYIILFSQVSSLISTVVTRTVPEVSEAILVLMIFGGITGGIIGRKINKKVENHIVDKLFRVVLVIIIMISIYNIWHYTTGNQLF